MAADPPIGRSPLGRRSPAVGAALPLFTGGAFAGLEASPTLNPRGRSRPPASPAQPPAAALPAFDLRGGGAAALASSPTPVEGLEDEAAGAGGEGAVPGNLTPGAAREGPGMESGAAADFFAPAFVNGVPFMAVPHKTR